MQQFKSFIRLYRTSRERGSDLVSLANGKMLQKHYAKQPCTSMPFTFFIFPKDVWSSLRCQSWASLTAEKQVGVY